MAYDTATGTAVPFVGHKITGQALGDTWTWDGTTWTEQAPATRPSARWGAALAYDAAPSNVVLFGGIRPRCCAPPPDRDTWTWDNFEFTGIGRPASAGIPEPVAGSASGS